LGVWKHTPIFAVNKQDMIETLLTFFLLGMIYVHGVKPLIGFKDKPFSEKRRIVLSLQDLD
jgi:hypothetical protein